jgi:adenosine deaminase
MKTVHAGEAYGPESIYEAISFLHADRIGHGYHLFSPDKILTDKVINKQGYTDALIRYVANRRITIEVCISSNLQTNPEIGAVSNHYFKHMLAEKLSVTLCTDNRLVSHTTVTKEYELALANFEIDRKVLRDLITYGFKRSFYFGGYPDKRAYVRKNIDYFDKIWEQEVKQK